jgi:hypothetical protein
LSGNNKPITYNKYYTVNNTHTHTYTDGRTDGRTHTHTHTPRTHTQPTKTHFRKDGRLHFRNNIIDKIQRLGKTQRKEDKMQRKAVYYNLCIENPKAISKVVQERYKSNDAEKRTIRVRKISLRYIKPTGNLESRVIDPVAPSMWLLDTLFSTACCGRGFVRTGGGRGIWVVTSGEKERKRRVCVSG